MHDIILSGNVRTVTISVRLGDDHAHWTEYPGRSVDADGVVDWPPHGEVPEVAMIRFEPQEATSSTDAYFEFTVDVVGCEIYTSKCYTGNMPQWLSVGPASVLGASSMPTVIGRGKQDSKHFSIKVLKNIYRKIPNDHSPNTSNYKDTHILISLYTSMNLSLICSSYYHTNHANYDYNTIHNHYTNYDSP